MALPKELKDEIRLKVKEFTIEHLHKGWTVDKINRAMYNEYATESNSYVSRDVIRRWVKEALTLNAFTDTAISKKRPQHIRTVLAWIAQAAEIAIAKGDPKAVLAAAKDYALVTGVRAEASGPVLNLLQQNLAGGMDVPQRRLTEMSDEELNAMASQQSRPKLTSRDVDKIIETQKVEDDVSE